MGRARLETVAVFPSGRSCSIRGEKEPVKIPVFRRLVTIQVHYHLDKHVRRGRKVTEKIIFLGHIMALEKSILAFCTKA